MKYEQDSVLRYIVSRLHPLENFVLIYAHGGINNNYLEVWKEIMRIAQFKYHRTMANILILHPTVGFRATFGMMYALMPAKIWDSTIYFETIAELKAYLALPNLELPQVCLQYEQERSESIFGSLW